MSKTSSSTGGISIFGLMFTVMFTLKLLGVFNYSWWVVTAPLWGPLAMVVSVVILICVIHSVRAVMDSVSNRRRKRIRAKQAEALKR